MKAILTIQNISKGYAGQNLFEGLNLILNEGEKIGLIGRNGCGKSTLLKIIAGIESCDAGNIAHHQSLQVAYLTQNPVFGDEETPKSIVEDALAPQKARIDAYDAICDKMYETDSPELLEQLAAEQAHIQGQIEQYGGWELSHRVENMLSRLKIGPEIVDQSFATLSGGQKRRVALARVLLEAPDILLLDEPTNHLDLESIEWLEGLLSQHRTTIILVTHDRAFLDAVATRIVEIHKSELLSFAGNYSNFVEQKADLIESREREREKYANLLTTELEWLKRGPKARTTKSKSRIERVADIQERAQKQVEKTLTLNFTTDQKLGNIIINAEQISKSYDKPLFKAFDFCLRKDDRLAIIGPNGCGKTTLLNILTGRSEADTGQVVIGKNTQIAFLSQHRQELNPEQTVYDSLGPGDHIALQQNFVHKRGYLARFLFDIPSQDKRISTLSGGEKCRLLFAQMMCSNANLLVLDEPTNDLDLDSLQTLEASLEAFNGSVLFVTHDRFLIDNIATAVLAFDPESMQFIRYEGDYSFYLLCKVREREAQAALAAAKEAKAVASKAQVVEKTKPRKLSYKESIELEGIEAKILKAEEIKAGIEVKIANPESYKVPGKAKELSDALDVANKNIEKLYERWNTLSLIAEKTT